MRRTERRLEKKILHSLMDTLPDCDYLEKHPELEEEILKHPRTIKQKIQDFLGNEFNRSLYIRAEYTKMIRENKRNQKY